MNKDDIFKKIIFVGLFIIPFTPFLVSSSFFFPFITTKAFAWRVIVEIIFTSWVLLAIIDANYRPKRSMILYSILVFLAIIGLADLLGVAPVKSFWSNFERMEGFITLLHLGMFFTVISSVFKEADWKKWWNTSLAASFIMVLYCVLQIVGLKTINQGGVRVDGTLGNAIYLAVYMLFHIFIAFFYMWREWKNVTLRWVYGLLIFGQLLILYYTATRGAILGLLGGLFVMAILNVFNKDKEGKVIKRASIVILISLVTVVGAFIAARKTEFVTSSPVLSRFSSLTIGELKTQGRYFVWPIAWEGIKERPLLGWGQENFNYVFNKYYKPEMYQLEPWFDRAHNIFLDWMVAGGILGIVSYLFLYASLLYMIWRRDEHFFHAEKSVLTGLIAAYFFHSFFVFDHLVSYILFFSLLSYVHSRAPLDGAWQEKNLPKNTFSVAWPSLGVALIAMLYFVNIQPMLTNTRLISALSFLQQQDVDGPLVAGHFRSAYETSRLGRPEVVEQIAANTVALLTSDMTTEEKNNFFSFAREVVTKQAEDLSLDARYQLVAGSLLSSTGSLDESLVYLERARDLMPGKQMIYLELANAFLNMGENQRAIETLEYVGEISPDHKAQMDEYIRQIQNS